MSIQPIGIQIEDKRKYGFVAFLVDRDDFLTDIQAVRKQIKLSNIPYQLPQYPYEEANTIVTNYNKGLLSINNVQNIFKDICKEKNLINLYHLDAVLGTAAIFAESLTKKYHGGLIYFPIILSSILNGKVDDFDFLSTYCLVLKKEDMHSIAEEVNLYGERVTIVVNPQTRPEEVSSVFDYIQKYQFGMKKIKKDVPPEYSLPDMISNIKRDREWYWENKKGKSAYRIWRELKTNIEPKTVEKAITQYKKRLTYPLN